MNGSGDRAQDPFFTPRNENLHARTQRVRHNDERLFRKELECGRRQERAVVEVGHDV